MGIESGRGREPKKHSPTDENKQKETMAKWFSTIFVQETEYTGRRERRGYPDVPISTPGGVRYVPGGVSFIHEETRDTGLSPMDQLAEFLNEHGESILDWRIVSGRSYDDELPILYLLKVEVQGGPSQD